MLSSQGRRIAAAAVLWFVGSGLSAQDRFTEYVRYRYQGRLAYGVLEGETIHELDGDLFDSPKVTGRTAMLSDVRLLPPCHPANVIAVGMIYSGQQGAKLESKAPGLFTQYPTSLVAHQDVIEIPPGSNVLHADGKLAIIIGKKANNISADEASHYIYGVTAASDVVELTFDRTTLRWFSTPFVLSVGPILVRGPSYRNMAIQTRLNGTLRHSEGSENLVFDVETAVSYASRFVTLTPGDVILTGSPRAEEFLKPGDVVEVEVERVGRLRNSLVAMESKGTW